MMSYQPILIKLKQRPFYQIEANGLDLFEYIKGDRDSIMGLPIKDIISYIKELKR
jgi:predicted house-cleaning NTP pyrophosphatase (Maf/HAM1 superfamily)